MLTHVRTRCILYVVMYVQVTCLNSRRKNMGKFTKDATELLKLVGGKENIQAVSHWCRHNY